MRAHWPLPPEAPGRERGRLREGTWAAAAARDPAPRARARAPAPALPTSRRPARARAAAAAAAAAAPRPKPRPRPPGPAAPAPPPPGPARKARATQRPSCDPARGSPDLSVRGGAVQLVQEEARWCPCYFQPSTWGARDPARPRGLPTCFPGLREGSRWPGPLMCRELTL
ncbi:atherin-like [Vulpes lagopus]|uniref:atherin-like n=1 Tax=Vulpes lagopus TaxID=494514 RepID=UPI001BC948F5|nr:atherin-like [Vulpes lagopus]